MKPGRPAGVMVRVETKTAQSSRPLSVAEAWQTLPADEWNEAAARHLLRRIGFSAPAGEFSRVLADGPVASVERYFSAMPEFTKPPLIARLETDGPEMGGRLRRGDPEQRRRAGQEARERSREALADLTIKWLQFAGEPAHSPAEKWLLFLQDVWVVGIDKVKNSALLYAHQQLLREHALGSNLALAKAVSRSPAMIIYLDLQQNQREAPNENFARELFELFTLGEGHYTEKDIKEAARAFTGYRERQGEFFFARRQHDDGLKTIFGRTEDFSGDDVLDLVFQQPAAASFLPGEMVRFYLSDEPLAAAYTEALGAWWAGEQFDLRKLAVKFFTSREFFAPAYRSGFIKSPVQFYLGLLQDLNLSVTPLPRQVIGFLRQMGQMPFNPPNVRGWVGGRSWINSATLAARRQLVERLLHPLNEETLNADEQRDLAQARAAGRSHFTIDESQLDLLDKLPAAEQARQLVAQCAPELAGSPVEHELATFLSHHARHQAGPAAIRDALATLLESPDYQLC